MIEVNTLPYPEGPGRNRPPKDEWLLVSRSSRKAYNIPDNYVPRVVRWGLLGRRMWYAVDLDYDPNWPDGALTVVSYITSRLNGQHYRWIVEFFPPTLRVMCGPLRRKIRKQIVALPGKNPRYRKTTLRSIQAALEKLPETPEPQEILSPSPNIKNMEI